MRENIDWFALPATIAVLAMTTMLPTAGAAGSKYKVLYKFAGSSDGANPLSGLVRDGAGNLYGTTLGGGSSSYGVVFKLRPNSNGTWTESVLHSFTGEPKDGGLPASGLIFDAARNLYGTTTVGPTVNGTGGVVFKLALNSGGTWTESVLYDLDRNIAQGTSIAGLIFDAAGNLYGTTYADFASNCDCGSVFKLVPNPDGSWTGTVLYTFTAGADGGFPRAGLVLDASGSLYGTTEFAGASGAGVVFKLTSNGDGTWTESVLHSFTRGADGGFPFAGLTFDAAGNLYGTTVVGGANGAGVVFQLAPNADGTWTESVLHSFTGGEDGGNPASGLIFDAAGNLYGTTDAGGCKGVNGGTVFKMSPSSNGTWMFSVLHVFGGFPAILPNALVLDGAGNLYGTTSECGKGQSCAGVVYEITP
jgi:uncharacterized repeat protein (TIGR03803 family)